MKLAALIVALALAAGALAAAAAKTLDIYFIDVEGGQSTLVVTPAGQSLLIDAGYPGLDARDPDRIVAAVRDAGVKRIDYLLVTHLHEDHNGGVAELQRRLPIGTFIDYGSPMETSPEVVASFAAYQEARTHAEHLVPKPGDRLPLQRRGRRGRQRRRRDARAAARRRRPAESGVRGRRDRRTSSAARTRGRSASASATGRSVFSISAT